MKRTQVEKFDLGNMSLEELKELFRVNCGPMLAAGSGHRTPHACWKKKGSHAFLRITNFR